MEAPFSGGKRKTIGGRGREWAHHCHKLLESMRELDDSEHFRNPVDSLKYKVCDGDNLTCVMDLILGLLSQRRIFILPKF